MEGNVLPLWLKVFSGVVLSLESLLGLCFNITAIICRNPRRLLGNRFVTTLCKIDTIISLFVIPLTITTTILPPPVSFGLCVFQEGAVSFASSASSACVLFVSVDRYDAVALPMKKKMNEKVTVFVRCSITILSGVGLILPFFSYLSSGNIRAGTVNMTFLSCRHNLYFVSPLYIYETYFLVLFATSVTVVITNYALIYRAAKKRFAVKMNITSSRKTRPCFIRRKQGNKLLVVTLAIAFSFIFCWGPYAVVSVLHFFMDTGIALTFCYLLAFSSPVLHPLVYTLLHDDLRRSLFRNRLRKFRQTAKCKIMPIDEGSSTRVCSNTFVQSLRPSVLTTFNTTSTQHF